MDIFDECFEHTVGLEGNYYNHPKDRGGPTMFGIAWNFNREWYKSIGIDSPEKVHLLNIDQAKSRYFNRYWVPSKCEKIKHFRSLVKTYFDMSIHAGAGGTGVCLQRAINIILLGDSLDIAVDGKVGNLTLQSLNSILDENYDPDKEVNEHNFVVVYNAQRASYYLEMYNDPENESWYGNFRYLNSGLRRLS